MREASSGIAPYFRKHVFCCINERAADDPRGCCKARGGIELRAYMKKRVKELGVEGVRVNAAGCLDRCELGPTMVIYPEGIWYRCNNPEDVERVIQRHLLAGEIVQDLVLQPEDG
jgi:(2Fe-2S) ferredoxin